MKNHNTKPTTARAQSNVETLLTRQEQDTWKKLLRVADSSLTEFVREVAGDHDIGPEDTQDIAKLYRELVGCAVATGYDATSARPIVSRILANLGLRQRAKRTEANPVRTKLSPEAKRAFGAFIQTVSDHVPAGFWEDIAKLARLYGAGKLTSKDLKATGGSVPSNVVPMPQQRTAADIKAADDRIAAREIAARKAA